MVIKCDSNPSYTYLVRVTTNPPDQYTGVFVYTNPPVGSTPGASKIVQSFSFSGTRTLCFKEDPASTVKNLVIAIDQCSASACALPGVWNAGTFMISVSAPSIGSDGGALLLQATSGAITYKASNNPVIDGGRPIIRNQLDPGLILTFVAIALVVAYIGYLAFKKFGNSKVVVP